MIDLRTISYVFAYVDEDLWSFNAQDILSYVLGERLCTMHREKMKKLLTEGIVKANTEKQNVKLPAAHVSHRDGKDNIIPSVVKLTIYYNHKEGCATHLFGTAETSYSYKYYESLVNKLSQREKECLECILANRSPKEIIRIMGVEESTVSTFKKRIAQKIGMPIKEIIKLYKSLDL